MGIRDKSVSEEIYSFFLSEIMILRPEVPAFDNGEILNNWVRLDILLLTG